MSDLDLEKPPRPWYAHYFVREPAAAIVFLAASTSIASLVFYLVGLAEFRVLLRLLLIPGVVILFGALVWAHFREKRELFQRVVAGLWAGVLATLLYDLVRVPVVMAGTPVFKAISYFGTVMLNQPSPSVATEIAGWTYHLSNGIGFGLMYALLVPRPSWWTALIWGLLLEGLMLLTPYAEVFGYRISKQFLAITIGAHIVYGLTLWGALKYWLRGSPFGRATTPPATIIAVPAVVAVLGIGLIAGHFHSRYASKIPPSPPDYVGPHLYVTWEVLEPDRVASLWILKRFVDPQARFHYQPVFSRVTRGTPFDTPEAKIRRTGSKSATEVLLAEHLLNSDPRLAHLARMTHIVEITPWMAITDQEAHTLAGDLRQAMQPVDARNISAAAQRGFAWLDAWYDQSPIVTSK